MRRRAVGAVAAARVGLLLLLLQQRCGGTAAYGESVPDGIEVVLDADGIEQSEGKEFVVAENGRVSENWVGTKDSLGKVVLRGVEESHFIIRSRTHPRGFGRPSIRVTNESIISPRLSGSAVQGGTVGHKDPKTGLLVERDLVVHYNCLDDGQTKVMLMIPFSSTNDNENDEDEGEKGVDDRPLRLKGIMMAAFTWTLACGSKARTGFTVQLIGDVNTPHDQYEDATPVVQDGSGVGAWAASVDWSSELAIHGAHDAVAVDPAHLYTVEASNNVTRFIVSLAEPPTFDHEKPQHESQPVMQPEVFTDDPSIMNPAVNGPLRKGGMVYTMQEGMDAFGDEPKIIKLFGQEITIGGSARPIDVEYNCIGVGEATVVLAIPFPGDNYRPVVFMWKKRCGGTVNDDIVVRMVGKTHMDDVVAHGEVAARWSENAVALGQQHQALNTDLETNFVILKEGTSGSATRFKEPYLEVGTAGIIEPVLEGNGRKGGQLHDADAKLAEKLRKSPAKLLAYGSVLGVVYNCIQPGEVQLTLTVPLMMHEDLKWQWTKSCGGLYRPFFAVSTWNKAVVRDGRAEDDWDLEFMEEPIAAAVESSEDMTSFFLTLDATDEVAEANILQATHDEHLGTEHSMGEELVAEVAAAAQAIPEKLAVQSYLHPRVEVSDKSILNPVLGGMARKGGTITSTGGQQQLDVQYHCQRPGEAIVTVSIPLEIYEDVTFSFRKSCNKKPVVGFNVGSTPAEDDVISDGQPWVYFDSRPGADGKRMVVEAEMPATTFFVWQKPLKCHSDCTQSELAAATSRGTPEDCAEVCKEVTVDFKEPVVKAEPEICSPRVGGEMRKGGQLSSEGPMSLTVRYNCHAQGETVITVRIEMEDETHDAVVWSWRKESRHSRINAVGGQGAGSSAQAEHHGSGGMPTHLIPVAGLMLIVVAGIYMLAGGSSANKGDGGDIESPRKFPRRTAQD